MSDFGKPACPVNVCRFINFRINGGDGAYVHDGSPAQPLPEMVTQHLEPHMAAACQVINRRFQNSHAHQQVIQKSFCGKEGIKCGINKDPADKIRYGCQRLHRLPIPFGGDFHEENRKKHRQYHGNQIQEIDAQRIGHNPAELPAQNGVGKRHRKPLQAGKGTIPDRQSRLVIKKSIYPPQQGKV